MKSGCRGNTSNHLNRCHRNRNDLVMLCKKKQKKSQNYYVNKIVIKMDKSQLRNDDKNGNIFMSMHFNFARNGKKVNQQIPNIDLISFLFLFMLLTR